ncbi:Glutaredoxin-like domain [Pseudomonas cuatrocienegasensis]|uniref:Glutaredoxin-like domain n=1 Tax=Pseudomonas cuatrocienegasensis TaxID=543360 RepID=A0ABY1BAS0_9PSED|nr:MULTISPECIES: glutaredoxin family protein [Pseudomonas]OEC34915.1 glutaredoxin [Pseudomonas sp. 21C1]SEQ39458.1 Glutaredoxin-like domain [Pseudomonas cuatrocienegasensis]
MRPECQLFGTLGCHLCEVAEALLMPFVEHGLLVELVDIAEQADWVEQYGVRIPVLKRCDTGAELDWPFDAAQIVEFLSHQG